MYSDDEVPSAGFHPKDALAWICVFGLNFGGVDFLYGHDP
jgi:hypothetical protein